MTSQPIVLAGGLDGLLSGCAAYDWLQSAVAVFDNHGTLRYANAAFNRCNQALRDTVEHLHQHALLFDCPAMRDWLHSAIASGTAVAAPYTLHYAPRISVELSLCFRPIFSGEQQLQGAMLTLGEESIEFGKRHLARAQEARHSLAERIKLLEREKLGNDKLIRVLLRDAPFAMLLMNGERQIVQSNRAAERLFGLAAGKMVGQRCDQLLSCYGARGCCPALTVQHRIDADEIEGHREWQPPLPLLRSAVVLEDERGPMVIEAFVDLSERKQAERALTQLSEYNRLLVESIGEGIFSVDRDLRCTFANEAAARMLGYKPAEMQGQDLHELIHARLEDGSPLPRKELPIYLAMKNNSSHKNDTVFWDKSGHAVAVQYLCNPLHDGTQVTGAVVVYRDVTEARLVAKKLDYLATHDSLTGLPNRHAFEQCLTGAMNLVMQGNKDYVLCYIDLDQFKVVNDTCGHAAGDELLRQLSDLMHQKVRKSDVFARLGGDEFGLLLGGCALDKALVLIEELLNLLKEFRFSWEGKTFALGASIGVVQLTEAIQDGSSAMSAADAACYIAKERGRNRLHVFQPDDQDLNQRQMEIEWVSRIKAALDAGRLQLWMQPIVPVAQPDDLGRHVEILLRMQADDGSIINPGAFIPAAERYGLMSDVDRWVVRRTLHCLSKNQHHLAEFEYCSINLSGQSITDEKFLDFLLKQLAEHPEVVKHLCFEITETAAVANLSRASQFMRRLKEAGCSFALDDFGSGMSSFAYLKNLPVDFLKIDGNFVRDMAQDKVDYAMVEAIHRVGSVMGIKTIAEFVEDDMILAKLKEIGVDLAQGYGIFKPMPMASGLSTLTNTGSQAPKAAGQKNS